MKNLVKTFIMSIAMVAAVTFSTVSTEAKEYKAQRNSNLYGMYLESTPNSENTVKNGVMNVVNADELSIYAKNDKIMYYEKANGTDVSKVKTPTIKSKHHEWGKYFKITKDTVIKFKVVKQKALYKKDGSFKKYAPITAAQLKKAKTYYVVIKVKKVNPFKQTKENVSLDKGKKLTVDVKSLDPATFDEFTYTTDGSNPTSKSRSLYTYNPTITINKNCTIKVAAFKLGKKVGTKTYNVTLKTYTKPSKYKFYTVESNWVCEGCQKVAYFDNGSGAYLTQSEIVVPEGFKLVTKYNGKNYYNYKLNTTNTFYYELYRARYYKVNGKYEFASWELMEKNTLTYKVFKNTFNDGYSGFYGFVAPVDGFVKDNKGYEGVWAYYKKDGDSTVYRTFLKPGEPLDPDYQWIADEVKINGEREWAATQVKYHHDGLFNEFCTYKAFMEAYNGLHDEVNTYGKPVTPEVPQ